MENDRNKVGADLPKGCMQPARDAIVEALTQLHKAVAMGCTGGIVVVDFYGFRVILVEMGAHGAVTKEPTGEPVWVISALPDTLETKMDLTKIALAIAPDREG